MKQKILLGVLLIAFKTIIECTTNPELTIQILFLDCMYVSMVFMLVSLIVTGKVYRYKLPEKARKDSIDKIITAIQTVSILALILVSRLATIWLVCDV